MATKKKPTTEAATKPKNVVSVALRYIGDTPDDALAWKLTQPEVQAAATIQLWQGDVCEVNALASALSLQIDAVKNGNMKRTEGMLLAQAHTLEGLFNSLARRAHGQEGLAQFDTFLRLALKAQSQCRSTLETLAAIKNPPVIFAKQANISNGHQQINNGISAPATHTGKTINQPNELLEAQHGSEILDTRATGATIGKNPAMATVD